MTDTIKDLVEKHADEIVALRRQFRSNPEISGQEFNTQRVIMEELAGQGLKPHLSYRMRPLKKY